LALVSLIAGNNLSANHILTGVLHNQILALRCPEKVSQKNKSFSMLTDDKMQSHMVGGIP